MINIVKPITTSQDKAQLVQFYRNLKMYLPNNFTSYWEALSNKDKNTLGIWKSKCIHDWKTNIDQQYQECKNCGIGHAL